MLRKTQKKNNMRTDAPKKQRKQLYENRWSKKTQKNYMRIDDPEKNPAETVQTFSKKTGTPNKNNS
jgi:hypothetical protein